MCSAQGIKRIGIAAGTGAMIMRERAFYYFEYLAFESPSQSFGIWELLCIFYYCYYYYYFGNFAQWFFGLRVLVCYQGWGHSANFGIN